MSAFKPTLAVNADFAKIVYPVYASPKLDGIRCSVVNGQALTMGALIVRDIKSGVEFNIGTGFTAAQRAASWVIGSMHKYKFFPIKDKPRHPVYLGARSALDL